MSVFSGWLLAAIVLFSGISFLVIRSSAKAPMKTIRRGSLAISAVAGLFGAQSVCQFLWNKTIQVSLATGQFWPKAPAGIHFESNATAVYVSGGFEKATVEVQGVSLTPRLALAAASALLALVVIALALFVARISKTIDSGSSLSQALVRYSRLTGWIVLLAGVFSGVLDLVGNNLAQLELLGTQRSFGWEATETLTNPWLTGDMFNHDLFFGFLMPSPRYIPELWPIAIALTLLLVSKLLSRANELEHEVEGLV
jgi:hypothetical protein